MLVWNAISSIVLMIFETFWLESAISDIDATMPPSASFDWVTRVSTSDISSAAWRECSAFCRVIDDISSIDAEVSSSDAACSLAPCESDCDAVAT
jgi:hypothetical protein